MKLEMTPLNDLSNCVGAALPGEFLASKACIQRETNLIFHFLCDDVMMYSQHSG